MKYLIIFLIAISFYSPVYSAINVDITDFVVNSTSKISKLTFGVRNSDSKIDPETVRDDLFFTSVIWKKPFLVCATLYNGLYVADLKKNESYFVTTVEGLKFNSIRKVALNGNYIVGFYANDAGGIFLFDLEKFKISHFTSQGLLDSSKILDCEIMGENLYVITDLGTLYRINYKTRATKVIQRTHIDDKSVIKVINFLDKKLYMFRAYRKNAVLYELVESRLKVKKSFLFEKSFLTWKHIVSDGNLYLWSCSDDFVDNNIIQVDGQLNIFQLNPTATDRNTLFAVSALTKWYKRFVFTPFLGMPHIADPLFTNIELVPLKNKLLREVLENNLCSFIKIIYGRIIFFTAKGAVGLPKNKIFEVIEQKEQYEELEKDKEELQKLATEQVEDNKKEFTTKKGKEKTVKD